MGEGVVLLERGAGRANIILNRPERRNSVTPELAEGLRDALREANADPGVGCIVLQGSGGAFCSGIDLAAAGDAGLPRPIEAWPAVHAAIYSSRVPVVVALERFAINAGAAFVLAADLAVAGESSFLQISEAAMGLAAPMNQAWLHLRHTRAAADRLTLLADRVPAGELLRLGVVTEVVADEGVLARANEIAERIAAYPASGRDGLRRVWSALGTPLEDPEGFFAALIRAR